MENLRRAQQLVFLGRVHDRISAETGFAGRSPTRSRLRVMAHQRFPRSITISRNSGIDSHAEGVTALERGGLEFEV